MDSTISFCLADSGLVERNNGPQTTWTLQQEEEKERQERQEIWEERRQEGKEEGLT